MTKFYLPDMTSVEAAQALKDRKVVVLPVGAIHKHGDGVIGTDIYSCTELSRRFERYFRYKILFQNTDMNKKAHECPISPGLKPEFPRSVPFGIGLVSGYPFKPFTGCGP